MKNIPTYNQFLNEDFNEPSYQTAKLKHSRIKMKTKEEIQQMVRNSQKPALKKLSIQVHDAKDKIDTAKTEAENAPIGKKVFAKQSVESYALEVALAEHKTKELEKQLRELFVYSGQADVYKSMMRTRQQERERRLKAARAAAEHKKLIADITLVSFCALLGVSILSGLVYIIIM